MTVAANIEHLPAVEETEDEKRSVATATWFMVNILLALLAATLAFGFAGFVTVVVAAAFGALIIIVALTAG